MTQKITVFFKPHLDATQTNLYEGVEDVRIIGNNNDILKITWPNGNNKFYNIDHVINWAAEKENE